LKHLKKHHTRGYLSGCRIYSQYEK